MPRGTVRAVEHSQRIAGLDLLRGFAILLVLIRHAWPEVIGSAGIVGVVVFFALSGYLITGLLTRDITAFGRVRYGRFYRNRAYRLIPALLFMLLGLTVVTLIWDPLGERDTLWKALLVGITYTGNLPFDHGSMAVEHLWTLATEEQFYLVWPVVIALGIRFKRTGLAIAITGAAILVALIGTIMLAEPAVGRIYPLPTSWAIAMVIGAAARVGQDRVSSVLPRAGRWRAVTSVAAVALLLAISLIPEAKASPRTYLVLGPAVAVLTVVLITHLREWQQLPTKWLRPILALGIVSYAAYLWNYPIVLWLGERPLDPFRAISSIILTIAAAAISWYLVEKPAARWKAKRHGRPTRVSAAEKVTDGPPPSGTRASSYAGIE